MCPIRLLQEYRVTKSPVLIKPTEPTPEIPVTDVQIREPVLSIQRFPQSPFKKVDVWPSVKGKTIITWEQNRLFTGFIREDATLALYFSYDDNINDWRLVSDGPLKTYLTDDVVRYRGQTIKGYYKLRITSGTDIYESRPVGLFQKLDFTSYKTALKILRAENMRIYHKSAGFLLKRRWMGTRCNRCNDVLTNISTESTCPICFGTGFIGGYYKPAIEANLELTPLGNSDQVSPVLGPINPGTVTARATSLVEFEDNDVFVLNATDERFRVHSTEPIVSIRSVPLVYSIQLKNIPASDSVYDFKVY